MNKFWVVWRSDGWTPVVRHVTKQSALNEAKRLAEGNAGKEFFVLEAISLTTRPPPPVVTTELEDPESIPF